MSQTNLNYTGQRLDDSGLLYYHARYYNPAIGRFISADSVVPGNAAGEMDGIALRPLTVDFHESGFVSTLNQENQQPFWFQMSDKQRQDVGDPWGPTNPQSLNRYSYVLNNTMHWTDPSGHATRCFKPGCAGTVYNDTDHSIWVVGSMAGPCNDGHEGVCENVLVEVPTGKSSADVGVYDADAIALSPVNEGQVQGAKLYDFERAHVVSDRDGKVTVVYYNNDPVLAFILRTKDGYTNGWPGYEGKNSRVRGWGIEHIKRVDQDIASTE